MLRSFRIDEKVAGLKSAAFVSHRSSQNKDPFHIRVRMLLECDVCIQLDDIYLEVLLFITREMFARNSLT